MFKSLLPLLRERGVHLLLKSLPEERISVYVEPVKRTDKEDDAFVTPFRCEGTPEELDGGLADALARWLTTRSAVTKSLGEAVAAAEAEVKAAAEEGRKKIAAKSPKQTTGGKPPAITTAHVAQANAPSPSLDDDANEPTRVRKEAQAAAAASVAAAVPAMSELF